MCISLQDEFPSSNSIVGETVIGEVGVMFHRPMGAKDWTQCHSEEPMLFEVGHGGHVLLARGPDSQGHRWLWGPRRHTQHMDGGDAGGIPKSSGMAGGGQNMASFS